MSSFSGLKLPPSITAVTSHEVIWLLESCTCYHSEYDNIALHAAHWFSRVQGMLVHTKV
jgi:hypothetical protein